MVREKEDRAIAKPVYVLDVVASQNDYAITNDDNFNKMVPVAPANMGVIARQNMQV